MDVFIATGKRKTSVARVRLSEGNGKITVNNQECLEYFKRKTLMILINQPFEIADCIGKYNIIAKVNGGGLSGQAGALKLGISRALLKVDEGLRQVLRSKGLLTRDSRMVERKKYGQKKARKKFQFSKR